MRGFRLQGGIYRERHRSLARLAVQRLDELGYDNVEVLHGDGSLGWPEHPPYDGIVVTAGGPEPPRSLPRQFDEFIWFDETRAVDALGPESGTGMPETFPFGL